MNVRIELSHFVFSGVSFFLCLMVITAAMSPMAASMKGRRFGCSSATDQIPSISIVWIECA
jgi:hypothetical protein